MPKRILSKIKRQVKKAQIKLVQSKRKFDINRSKKKGLLGYSYSTARQASHNTHGKGFLKAFPETELKGGNGRRFKIYSGRGSYESENAIHAVHLAKGSNAPLNLAWINIGFKKDTLIIESMQTDREAKARSNEFRRVTKTQVLNFLVKQAEAHARSLGFKEVKIRLPETLHYFSHPVRVEGLSDNQVRRNMKILYGRVARTEGYKKQGLFFEKQL